jgi:predicted transcriptional regulator
VTGDVLVDIPMRITLNNLQAIKLVWPDSLTQQDDGSYTLTLNGELGELIMQHCRNILTRAAIYREKRKFYRSMRR